MKFYFLLTFSFASVIYILIALKFFLDKRLIFISTKSIFSGQIVFIFFPAAINIMVSMQTKGISNISGFILVLTAIIFIFFVFFIWAKQIQKIEEAYRVIGASNDSFREALHFSLNKNNLSLINIKPQVTQLKDGVNIALKETNNQYILLKIMEGINDYYIENNVKLNNMTLKFYIKKSILILVFGLLLFFILSLIE